MKRFFIKTYGCQMNVSDSEKMRSILEGHGMTFTEKEEKADLIIVNSCAVREKPQEKIFSYMGRFPKETTIILAGCVAQSEREAVWQRRRGPDFIIGTHQFHRLGEIAEKLASKKSRGQALGFSRKWQEIVPDFSARTSPVTAFISIMEGCDNFCSYCIVPFTRGREKHRPFSAIMKEAEQLSRHGCAEIILLGQNVNSWRDEREKISFPRLLEKLARDTDIRWIRFITSYPGYHDPGILPVIAENPSIARHLHFPAQSGSTRILKMMNRSYSRSRYLEITRQFRKAIPGFSFSSDFITGFPGETEKDFESTLTLLRKVEYDSVFSFVYSPRRRTKAYQWEDPVPLEVKKERLHRLQVLQAEIQLRRNRELIGKEIEVLATGPNPKKKGEMIGRTESYRVVNFPGPAPAEKFLKIHITQAGPHSLRGKIMELC